MLPSPGRDKILHEAQTYIHGSSISKPPKMQNIVYLVSFDLPNGMDGMEGFGYFDEGLWEAEVSGQG